MTESSTPYLFDDMKLLAKKLPRDEVDKIVFKKKLWLLKHSDPLKIILFGSAACNEMTDSSDVDLIAIYKNGTDIKKVSRELSENRSKSDWPHDLLLLTEEEFNFYRNKGGGACWLADQEGVVLHEKGIQK